MAEGGGDIVDVVKGLSLSRLGLLRVGGRGGWSVGLHGRVLVFVVGGRRSVVDHGRM